MAHEAVSPLLRQVVVSVQADGDEPLNTPDVLLALCESVLSGGARVLRLSNPEVIRAVRQRYPHLRIIGLHKPDPVPPNAMEQVYITATLERALQTAEAGASIVALDATNRPRPDDLSLAETVAQFREVFPDTALMADCSSLADAQQADTLGVDCIGTTLAGYTHETGHRANGLPDWELLQALLDAQLNAPIFLEGRVWQPEQVTQAFERGADAVVVGSAITRPHLITRRFIDKAPSP